MITKQSKKNQQKIIRLAKLDGWFDLEIYHPPYTSDYSNPSKPIYYQPKPFLRGHYTIFGGQTSLWNTPPDYLNDLNAVLKLKLKLVKSKKLDMEQYEYRLQDVLTEEGSMAETADLLNSTARQQSDAILRTVRK